MLKKAVLSSEIQVVDSHTAGEPTRVVIAGGPALGSGALEERLRRFAAEYDDLRSAVVNEPRGSDVMVGALLCEPHDPNCNIGVAPGKREARTIPSAIWYTDSESLPEGAAAAVRGMARRIAIATVKRVRKCTNSP